MKSFSHEIIAALSTAQADVEITSEIKTCFKRSEMFGEKIYENPDTDK